MARWRDEIGERRAGEGKGTPLGPALAGFSLFCILALLLNGESLHQNAHLLPYPRPVIITWPHSLSWRQPPPSFVWRSPARAMAIRLSAPLAAASRATGLNRFRARLETLFHTDNPQPAPPPP